MSDVMLWPSYSTAARSTVHCPVVGPFDRVSAQTPTPCRMKAPSIPEVLHLLCALAAL